MLNATLKGLAAHKLRLALTALAIVLGVSFVAGTYVLTDTISKTFDELFQNVTQNVDVVVRGKDTISDQSMGELRTPLPASLKPRIEQVDGVKLAEGSVTSYAQFVKKDGHYLVRLRLPFASKSDVGLFKKGDELVVQIGTLRRHIGLPTSMAHLTPTRAKLEDRLLTVEMEENP